METPVHEPKNLSTAPSYSLHIHKRSWIGTTLLAVLGFVLLIIAGLYIWGEQITQDHTIPASLESE